MGDRLRASLEQLPLGRLDQAAAVVSQAIAAGQGVRLGQSAVLSTKVHAFQPRCPEHVQILINSDAGQVFYQRQDEGAVWHLDIFHQCGRVDHRQAARHLCQAIAVYNACAANQTELACRGAVNPALLDIQTATGGGRITGSLQGGKKRSVRRAHENHVHVALSIPPDELPCLFYIVAAAEAAVAESGLELRCNEGISHVDSTDSLADISPYTDQTDSQLVGKPPAGQTGQEAACTSEAVPSRPPPDSTGSPAVPPHKQQLSAGGKGQTLVVVKEAGIPARDRQAAPPLAKGAFPGFCAPGLHDSLRQAVHNVRSKAGPIPGTRTLFYNQAAGRNTSASLPFSAGVDVAATVSAAAARLLADGMTGRLQISPADLRFVGRRPGRGSDICLLVDSSGSMAGFRLQAARYVAGELSRYGCSRLSLVTFQDNRADLIVPFTAGRQTVLSAFDTITTFGATPLALGIRRSLAYIAEQQACKPLLVLITDGIPSRKYEEAVNPLTDALAAAVELKQANCAFLCIGLDADEGFLKKLADTAGGVSYIFTELEKQLSSPGQATDDSSRQ
ncbi:vWA domain-containing protein [Sporomusa sphaeroides]|jgi:magnesium chelatase subunit D|uniref:vWA domain-containing protein n=1 Tax=Sporomusa sphaeroides TaxID=47679 RepID=UPI003158E168